MFDRSIREQQRCGPHAHRQQRKDSSAVGPAQQPHRSRRYTAQQKHLCRKRQLGCACASAQPPLEDARSMVGGWVGSISLCHTIWSGCPRFGCWTTNACLCCALCKRHSRHDSWLGEGRGGGSRIWLLLRVNAVVV